MSRGLNRVFGHRNSGVSYIIKSLMANYQCDYFDVSYLKYDSGMYKAVCDSHIALYVVRDGRDVLVDCYNYFRKQPGTRSYFENKTFRHYIMGYVEAYTDKDLFEDTNQTKNPLSPKMFSNPIGYWVDHINSYIESHIDTMYFVNYDLMLLDPADMLMHIGEYYNLKPRYRLVEPLEDLIYYKPVVRDIGVWRTVFLEKDLQYFWGQAEDLMLKLKYSYK